MTTAAQAINSPGDTLFDRLDTADFIPTLDQIFVSVPSWRLTKQQLLAAGVVPPPLNDPAFQWAAGYLHANEAASFPAYIPANQPYPGFSWLASELAPYPNGQMMRVEPTANRFAADGSGVLTIFAERTPPPVVPYLPIGFAALFLSGAMHSFPFSQQFGYFEIEMQPPGPAGAASVGTWPAFWMLPSSDHWPPEADIVEIVGGKTNIVNCTLHSGALKSVLPNGSSQITWATDVGCDLSRSMNCFGMDWGPLTTRFYFNRDLIFSFPTPADWQQPFYLLANLAIGGPISWGGTPSPATVLPAKMRIAAIRAWQRVAYRPTNT